MNDMEKKIYETGIIPVVKINDDKDAVALAAALREGGLNCAEITFRTQAAEGAIKKISAAFPDMLIGAGTVLTCEQAARAAAAGAKFIVTPGLNEETVKYCLENNIPIYPGCSTPSDIEKALSMGLTTLKFFPAEAAGGVAMIKALCGPYVNVHFMPTGGINADNINDYLAYDKIIACGGSWIVKDALISAGKFDEITALVSEAVSKMLGFKLLHIGVNCADESDALSEAEKLAKLLNLPVKNGNSSVFAGTLAEMMKGNGRGTHGHIAVGVNNVDRAYAYLKNRGYAFAEDTVTYDDNGRRKVAYLKDEFAGFAIHLVANK